ncbi:kinase-like protein [Testicularia cyperi]|uniref:Kinase-like protein n=1 Tax=Testicularia cyperi TaxID=1882483 RepID=A0A317XSX1_9BASI|nr:kinase-like protein [Testicularia cyperi]
MHPNLTTSFSGAGGGRAAARDRARKQTDWENAPFSVLEAQRHVRTFAYSQPASPGLAATSVAWDPSISIPALPTAAVTETPIHFTPKSNQTTGDQTSPQLQQLPSALAIEPAAVRSGLQRQRSDHNLSRSALARIDTALGLHDAAATSTSLPVSAEAAVGSFNTGSTRPLPSRSPSGSGLLSTASMLRTPTTEEWSRFLESQGVDLAGRHSRAGTHRSTGSATQLASRLGMTSLQPTARPDLEADGDSDMDSDDSDSHDLGVEVLEKLKQLGLSRAASRAGSVIGEELGSLDEEDEENMSPVSPQLDRLGGAQEEMPSTPLASAHPSLPTSSSMPMTLTLMNEATPPAHQMNLDRGVTMRLPRSKRPTATGMGQTVVNAYAYEPPGEKRIEDFEIVSDIGRGAYGLVKKARKKGADGRGQGEEVIIKYIIKSRILADCWRRHRSLGPIPVEIHVMDQLRRIPYAPPSRPRPWSPARARTLEEWRLRRRQEAERDAETEGSTPENGPASSTAVDGLASQSATAHPNICKMLDFFEDHEFYYLVMPCFGRGQDLFDFVESAPDGLDLFQSRSIFGQVADALWFLHANNIVHRDVKDENVILDGEGNAQLIDFGSAAHARPGKLFDTFSGTLDYAAAEILQGEKYAGQAQDVWALGVVGFVLLCGECPFWNGEEAIQGLEEGTRACQTLKDRCMIARGGPAAAEADLSEQSLEVPPLDPAWSPLKDKAGAEPDGGGRVEDFADLITRCLEIDPEARPTAEHICQHRFLAGQQGWSGRLGWQRLRTDIVPSCVVASEPTRNAVL